MTHPTRRVHYSVVQCVAVCCSALQCIAVRFSALQCIAVRCSALQCVAVRCSASRCAGISILQKHETTHPTRWVYYVVATISRLLQIIGLFGKRDLQKRLYSAKETYNFKKPTDCSHHIRSITVRCRVLPCVAVSEVHCSVLRCAAACCSALQCVVVCCSVLQCVAACCNVLHLLESLCSGDEQSHELEESQT